MSRSRRSPSAWTPADSGRWSGTSTVPSAPGASPWSSQAIAPPPIRARQVCQANICHVLTAPFAGRADGAASGTAPACRRRATRRRTRAGSESRQPRDSPRSGSSPPRPQRPAANVRARPGRGHLAPRGRPPPWAVLGAAGTASSSAGSTPTSGAARRITLCFGTGAGTKWGSDPESEWAETQLQARRLIALASGRR